MAASFRSPPAPWTALDNARLTEFSPGLYLLDTQASNVKGGWGHMSIDGLVDFGTGTARWLAKGQLCQR